MIQFPAVTELVTLRTTYETTYATYTAKKAALIERFVSNFLVHRSQTNAKWFRDTLEWNVQDPALIEEIWSALLPHLTPDDFAGWYMLRANGEDQKPFPADNN